MSAKKATKKVAKRVSKKTATKKRASTKQAQSTQKTTTSRKTKQSNTTKSTGSRKSTPSRTKRTLVEAAPAQAFWATNGAVIKNLVELQQALSDMHEAAFRYHVTPDKHDFAEWVERVLEDVECAEALRKTREQKKAHTVVVRFVKKYDV